MKRVLGAWSLTLGVAVSFACAEPAKAPPTEASAALPPLPLPGDVAPFDAAGIAPKEAGSSSDCIPAAPTGDGDIDEAVLGAQGRTLSLCVVYHTPMAEAPAGRACFEVDLEHGRYDRIGPFGPPQMAADPLQARLAQHASNGFSLAQTGNGSVAVCKAGAACETVVAEGYKPLDQKESCLPDALASYLPAAVSPDGSQLFVVRHEACDTMHVFGEAYDIRSKRRLARFPLKTDALVDDVAWLGARVAIRACTFDRKVCTLSLVDPKAPATPEPHGYANAAVVPGVNPAGLDTYAVHAQGDLFALVDRLGGAVVFAHADTGAVERTVTLPPAPDMRRPLAVAVRQTPSQLLLVYGGQGRMAVVDLATMAQTAAYHAPICGEEY